MLILWRKLFLLLCAQEINSADTAQNQRRHGRNPVPPFFDTCMKMVYFGGKTRKNVQNQTRMLFLDVAYKNSRINLAIVGEK